MRSNNINIPNKAMKVYEEYDGALNVRVST